MLPASGPFVFEPRSLVREWKQFGRSSGPLEPDEGVDPGDLRLRTAQLQHKVSNAVREALLREGITLKAFAENVQSPGMSHDRLARIQRGKTLMQLADLVNWAGRFPEVRAILAEEWSEDSSRRKRYVVRARSRE